MAHKIPDFKREWCQKILTDPSTAIIDRHSSGSHAAQPETDNVMNAMFSRTLYNTESDAIRAQVSFTRPFAGVPPNPRKSSETESATSILPEEYCYLLSLGPGIDGLKGRAHGGFNALVLDNITGSLASMIGNSTAPATARLEIDYVGPIDTPGVVLARAWATERSGRKTWVNGVIEDSSGRVLARGRALYIDGKVRL